MTTATEFQAAIAAYAFPGTESIHGVTVEYEPGAAYELAGPHSCLFRPAGPRQRRHVELAHFWASALFSYLEDRWDDGRFEELGASGVYAPVDTTLSDDLLKQVLAGHTGEVLPVPAAPDECYLAHDVDHLKSVVGHDRVGFFAVFFAKP